MKNKFVLGIAIVALVAGLAACSGKSDQPNSDQNQSETVPTPVEKGQLPPIPEGKGIIKNTVLTSATTDPGTTVTAKGTVQMPEGESGDIAISVSWVNSDTSSVYTRGVTVLENVAAGETVEWETSADLPSSAEKVTTTLGAVIVGQ